MLFVQLFMGIFSSLDRPWVFTRLFHWEASGCLPPHFRKWGWQGSRPR